MLMGDDGVRGFLHPQKMLSEQDHTSHERQLRSRRMCKVRGELDVADIPCGMQVPMDLCKNLAAQGFTMTAEQAYFAALHLKCRAFWL